MTDTSAVQGQLASQDTTQILQRIFTGHIVGQPAMGYIPLSATVVSGQNTTGKTTVKVTVDGFDTTATFTCHYTPRFHWNGSTNVASSPPPAGTKCLVSFPTNDAQGYGWAIGFTGWPTE